MLHDQHLIFGILKRATLQNVYKIVIIEFTVAPSNLHYECHSINTIQHIYKDNNAPPHTSVEKVRIINLDKCEQNSRVKKHN